MRLLHAGSAQCMSARPEPSGSKQPYPLKMLHAELVAHLYGVNFPIQIEVTTTLIVRNHNGGINSRRAIRAYGTVAVARLWPFGNRPFADQARVGRHRPVIR